DGTRSGASCVDGWSSPSAGPPPAACEPPGPPAYGQRRDGQRRRHRHLRLRNRGAHRAARRARGAAARGPDLPRRHRTHALRQQVRGDRHALRSRERRFPPRATPQAAGARLHTPPLSPPPSPPLDALSSHVPGQFTGVVEPGVRAAIGCTRNGRVGVIGTEATIGSGAYTRALRAQQPRLEVFTRACPLFVPLAEEGWTDGAVARGVAETYLASLARSGIDTLILGCTHYPLLKPLIAEVMGPAVTLVDSAEETAREVAARLAADGMARAAGPGSTSFFVTDAPERFIRIGQRFLGARVESAV